MLILNQPQPSQNTSTYVPPPLPSSTLNFFNTLPIHRQHSQHQVSQSYVPQSQPNPNFSFPPPNSFLQPSQILHSYLVPPPPPLNQSIQFQPNLNPTYNTYNPNQSYDPYKTNAHGLHYNLPYGQQQRLLGQ